MGFGEAAGLGARRVGGAVELMRPATAQSQSSPVTAIKRPHIRHESAFAATGARPAENLLPAAWRRVSLAARIPAVAARDRRTLAKQEGGTQMRTITSFLLPARTSCIRSFCHVQLSVPPRQAAV